MSTGLTARQRPLGRLERAALQGVMVRRARRHRGARDRRGAVDLGEDPYLRMCADARGHGLRPGPELFHCVELVRQAVFGFEGWEDVGHLAFLVGFALVSWRLAIRFMERRLIL
jgi:hypothetical protein